MLPLVSLGSQGLTDTWCSGVLLNELASLGYLPGLHQKRSTEAAMGLQTYKLIDIPVDFVLLLKNHQYLRVRGTHGLTKRLRGYTSKKQVGNQCTE